MNKRTMIIAVCAVLLLLGCGGKKERKATSSQLIGQVEQFSIDTIVTTPGDTLVNNTVDGVLRHYPELYRATQKAVKAYDKWVEAIKVLKHFISTTCSTKHCSEKTPRMPIAHGSIYPSSTAYTYKPLSTSPADSQIPTAANRP